MKDFEIRTYTNDYFQGHEADRRHAIQQLRSRQTNFIALSAELRQDEDVIKAAIKLNILVVREIPDIKRLDYDTKKLILSYDGEALSFLDETDKNDSELVLIAIESMPSTALRFASEEIQDNKEVVAKSVFYEGVSLVFASDRLRQDKDIIEITRQQSFSAAMGFAIFETEDSEMAVIMKQFEESLLPIANFLFDIDSKPEAIQAILKASDKKFLEDSEFYSKALIGMDTEHFSQKSNAISLRMVDHLVSSLSDSQLKKMTVKNPFLTDLLQQENLRRNLQKIGLKNSKKPAVRKSRKVL